MNIFVGSLPFSIEEADLRESFEAYGAVDSVKIITDKFTGRSKGFGFVEMPSDEEAQKAIDELNGATVQGRAIVVNKSEAKEEVLTTTVVEIHAEVTETTVVVEIEEEDINIFFSSYKKSGQFSLTAFLFFIKRYY